MVKVRYMKSASVAKKKGPKGNTVNTAQLID